MKHWISNTVVLTLFAVALTVPVFWSARSLFFRLFSDYDALLPVYFVITETLRTGVYAAINPYVSFGIPVLGDPLSGFGNPFLYLPLIIFGVPLGMRVVIVQVIVLSGLAMVYLLLRLRVSRNVQIWGALLYMTSGGIYARIVAGHWEQLFAFPVVPIVVAQLMFWRTTPIRILVLATALAGLGWAGAWYQLWFLLVIMLCLRIVETVRNPSGWMKQVTGVVLLLAVVFVLLLPKITDFYVRVIPIFQRQISDTARGSLSLPLFILPFIIPFQVNFYDRPLFQRWFGFYYNWYEYYAFIAPISFVYLWKIKQIVSKREVKILLLILLVGSLYIAKQYPYSPFYWIDVLLPAAQYFRVPQRMYTVLLAPLIGLIALSFDYWYKLESRKRIKHLLVFLSVVALVWNSVIAKQTLQLAFEPEPKHIKNVVSYLKQSDNSKYFVGSLICCTQWYLVTHHLPVVNYYYGWFHKDAPAYAGTDGVFNGNELERVRPKYLIISHDQRDLVSNWYTPVYTSGDIMLVVAEHPNVSPVL